MAKPRDDDQLLDRRRFLRLGALLSAGGLCSGVSCTWGDRGRAAPRQYKAPTREENLQVWKRKAGTPYLLGKIKMPGVCNLPGPFKKHRFPDPDKYKNTTKVHGLCQLCSTICGITGHVKNGRIIKVEGNPNDPNSRGRLCARG